MASKTKPLPTVWLAVDGAGFVEELERREAGEVAALKLAADADVHEHDRCRLVASALRAVNAVPSVSPPIIAMMVVVFFIDLLVSGVKCARGVTAREYGNTHGADQYRLIELDFIENLCSKQRQIPLEYAPQPSRFPYLRFWSD